MLLLVYGPDVGPPVEIVIDGCRSAGGGGSKLKNELGCVRVFVLSSPERSGCERLGRVVVGLVLAGAGEGLEGAATPYVEDFGMGRKLPPSAAAFSRLTCRST